MKRFFSIIISISLMVILSPVYMGTAVQASEGGETELVISKDSQSAAVTFDSSSKIWTINEPGKYSIYNIDNDAATNEHVIVNATEGEVIITFKGVNIDTSADNQPAFLINSNVNVTILLQDSSVNTLISGGTYAGIDCSITHNQDEIVSGNGNLTIGVPEDQTGSGVLNATGGHTDYYTGGAGIGGRSNFSINKSFITGGIINATGQYGSAGIGGGANNTNAEVTISGGTVTAKSAPTSSDSASGIGCGANSSAIVNLVGGSVTAIGDMNYTDLSSDGKGALGVGSTTLTFSNTSQTYSSWYQWRTSTDISVDPSGTYSTNIFTNDSSYKIIQFIPKPSYNVSITKGNNMALTTATGTDDQTVVTGINIKEIKYTAADGYYFPIDYGTSLSGSGITVTVSEDQHSITVNGSPTDDKTINLPSASAKNALTITGVNVSNKKYDGTAIVPTGTPVCSYGQDTVSVDGLVYTYSGRGETVYDASTTAPKDAGFYTLTISVPDTNKTYKGSSTADFSITKEKVSIDVDSGQFKYERDNDPTLTYKIESPVAGETAKLTGSLSRDSGETVGTYSITHENLSLTDNGTFKASNYTLDVDGTETFEIRKVSLESISISTPPKTTKYIEGYSFDPTGMVITVTYNNGKTAAVTGYTCSDTALKTTDTKVKITYVEDGITKTVDQPITVSAISAGEGGTHIKETIDTLVITCTGQLSLLSAIKVDDTVLGEVNYDVKKGSTILTLKAAYLNKLTIGTHSLEFNYSDGTSASTTFKVLNKATSAPSGLTDGNDKIVNTTDKMEYSSDQITWKPCTDGSTKVTPGTYYVRFKETDKTAASDSVKITVTNDSYKIVDTADKG